MVRELITIAVAIASAAAKTVLFVGPEDDPDGAARTQVQLLHQAQRLPRHDRPAAIVGRSRSDVPRVEVATDDDHFVRELASTDLTDDVERIGVGEHLRFHLQSKADGRAAVRHALQAIGVFRRDRSGRDLRGVGVVGERAGVRRPQSGWAHGSHQRGHCPELRRA